MKKNIALASIASFCFFLTACTESYDEESQENDSPIIAPIPDGDETESDESPAPDDEAESDNDPGDESESEDGGTDPVEVELKTYGQTPLARLTNDEFINSTRSLLNLPAESTNMEAARPLLVAEANIKGLRNDAQTQALSQLAIAGFSSMAGAATSDFLSTTTNNAGLRQALDCEGLSVTIGEELTLNNCINEFIKALMRKAFNRELNDLDEQNITAIITNVNTLYQAIDVPIGSFEARRTRVESLIRYVLLSPEFLLIAEKGIADRVIENTTSQAKFLSNNEIATRLALFLTGTLPDEALLDAAKAGLLTDATARLEQAERLMASPASTNQFSKQITGWLDIKDASSDPESVLAAETFVTDWYASEAPFSAFYQAPISVSHSDGEVTQEPFGVLGLKAFVDSHTEFPTPSFITRGVFVVERLLCEKLPDGVPDEALGLGELTPVEVFEIHAQQACATCHRVFDNYGAAFQQFDPETGLFDPSIQQFGASFDLYDIGDVTASVSGIEDLSLTLGTSSKAPACMAELLYRHSVRRNLDANGYDDHVLTGIIENWAQSGDQSLKDLLRVIIASDNFITLFL